MRLTVTIPRPPSINAMYANNPGKGSKGRFNTERYRCWLTEAGLHLNRQLGGWVMLTGPVKAIICCDKGKADLQNLEKAPF